jgi:hypothetical protein
MGATLHATSDSGYSCGVSGAPQPLEIRKRLGSVSQGSGRPFDDDLEEGLVENGVDDPPDLTRLDGGPQRLPCPADAPTYRRHVWASLMPTHSTVPLHLGNRTR